jgi:hypothetical protein
MNLVINLELLLLFTKKDSDIFNVGSDLDLEPVNNGSNK